MIAYVEVFCFSVLQFVAVSWSELLQYDFEP